MDSTGQDQKGEVVPEPAGPPLPYNTEGLGMDSTGQDQEGEVVPEPTTLSSHL